MAGWDYPLTRGEMIAADTNDLLLTRWSEKGKFKPYPRPWSKTKKVKKTQLTAAQAMKILRPHNASLPG